MLKTNFNTISTNSGGVTLEPRLTPVQRSLYQQQRWPIALFKAWQAKEQEKIK